MEQDTVNNCRNEWKGKCVSALCHSPLKPSLVREFAQFIFPVLRGFFSGYSGFCSSLKSTQIRHLRVTRLSVSVLLSHVTIRTCCFLMNFSISSRLLVLARLVTEMTNQWTQLSLFTIRTISNIEMTWTFFAAMQKPKPFVNNFKTLIDSHMYLGPLVPSAFSLNGGWAKIENAPVHLMNYRS